MRCVTRGGMRGAGFLLLLFSRVAVADGIATDRPGGGNAAQVVPKGAFQLEGGSLSSHGDGADTHAASLAIRWGLAPNVELRAASLLLGWNEGGDGKLYGGDLVVGAKYQWAFGQAAATDLAAMVDVALPTGGGPFTGTIVSPEFRLALARGLGGPLGVLLNGGLRRGRDGTDFVQGIALLQLNAGVEAWRQVWGGFVEIYSEHAGGGRPDLYRFDAGATWSWHREWQADVSVLARLRGAGPRIAWSVGLSHRL